VCLHSVAEKRALTSLGGAELHVASHGRRREGGGSRCKSEQHEGALHLVWVEGLGSKKDRGLTRKSHSFFVFRIKMNCAFYYPS
jgi:hypothetical protein